MCADTAIRIDQHRSIDQRIILAPPHHQGTCKNRNAVPRRMMAKLVKGRAVTLCFRLFAQAGPVRSEKACRLGQTDKGCTILSRTGDHR